MENLPNPTPPENNINTFIDTLKTSRTKGGIKDKDALSRLEEIKTNPDLKKDKRDLEDGVFDRITSLRPRLNSGINQKDSETLRFCLSLAYELKMDRAEEVKLYLDAVKGRLPKPEPEPEIEPGSKPKTSSRRQFIAGLATGIAGVTLLPKAINALIPTPEQPKPKSEPLTKPPETTIPPKPTNTTFVKPTLEPSATIKPQIPTATQTATTEASPTTPPSATKSPEATATLEKPIDPIQELLKPFIESAQKQRAERQKNDPEYAHRVDSALNQDRPFNIFLDGWGETFEPPNDKAIIGSPTIISFNQKTGAFDTITLTHDIRAVEIERAQAGKGEKPTPTKIDRAYSVGGFKLTREIMESATGLAIDFQINLKDSLIKDFVNEVLGKLDVNLPFDLETQAFYQDGTQHKASRFEKGPQSLPGTEVMRLMKALPVSYDRTKERSVRKQLVFGALIQALNKNAKSPEFLLKGLSFLTKEMAPLIGHQRLQTDFDFKTILMGLGSLAQKVKRSGTTETAISPKFDRSVYIVDPYSGDGGVRWVEAAASNNPKYKKELGNKKYPDINMAVPPDGDPDSSDLVKDYWGSVRKLVKDRLS